MYSVSTQAANLFPTFLAEWVLSALALCITHGIPCTSHCSLVSTCSPFHLMPGSSDPREALPTTFEKSRICLLSKDLPRQAPPGLTWPLAKPSKPSYTANTLCPSEMPTRTAARTAAFMPAAGAPTFTMPTLQLLCKSEGGRVGVCGSQQIRLAPLHPGAGAYGLSAGPRRRN